MESCNQQPRLFLIFFARPIAKTRDIINILTRGGDYRGDTSTPNILVGGTQRLNVPPTSGGLCPSDQGLCPWTPLGAPPPTPHHSEEIAATDTNNHNNVASLSKLTASIFYKLIFTEYNAMDLIVCSFAYGWGE